MPYQMPDFGAGVDSINIFIDGVWPEIHDEIQRYPSDLNKAMRDCLYKKDLWGRMLGTWAQ